MCMTEGCIRRISYGGLRLCSTCYSRHLRAKRIRLRLCSLCGKPPKSGYAHCQKCLWKIKQRYHTAVENDVCPTCKSREPLKGVLQCLQCRKDNRRRLNALHASYRASGICIRCGKRPVVTKGSTSCPPCQTVMRKKALLHRQRIKAGL